MDSAQQPSSQFIYIVIGMIVLSLVGGLILFLKLSSSDDSNALGIQQINTIDEPIQGDSIVPDDLIMTNDLKESLVNATDFDQNPAPTNTITIKPTPPPPITNPQPKPTTSSKLKFGIATDQWTGLGETVSKLAQTIGRTIDIVSLYCQFGSTTTKAFPASDIADFTQNAPNIYIAWEPWDPNQELRQTTDYLDEITTGKLDSYLTQFAKDIQSYKNPVTIRFGHEMNGDWYPWSNRPDEYKNAYRYIVDLFNNIGVTNVRWMWSINHQNIPQKPINSIDQFYPGDKYVDIIGIDGFNFGMIPPYNNWVEFSALFEGMYHYLSTTYDKPLAISEVASAEQGGDKADWVKQMFMGDLTSKFTNITEVVWSNSPNNKGWRIDSTDSSLKSFQDSL